MRGAVMHLSTLEIVIVVLIAVLAFVLGRVTR
jgi:hypothetical protein